MTKQFLVFTLFYVEKAIVSIVLPEQNLFGVHLNKVRRGFFQSLSFADIIALCCSICQNLKQKNTVCSTTRLGNSFFLFHICFKIFLPSHMVIYILQRLFVTLLLKLSKNITFNYYGFYTLRNEMKFVSDDCRQKSIDNKIFNVSEGGWMVNKLAIRSTFYIL